MSQDFDAKTGLILIVAEVSGPIGKANATLVLDTGATNTMLNSRVLRSIGHDPALATVYARITTGSSVETAPRLMINRLSALGQHAVGMQIVAHDLPAGTAVDGLLGLDFFRGAHLAIDFRAGKIVVN